MARAPIDPDAEREETIPTAEIPSPSSSAASSVPNTSSAASGVRPGPLPHLVAGKPHAPPPRPPSPRPFPSGQAPALSPLAAAIAPTNVPESSGARRTHADARVEPTV